MLASGVKIDKEITQAQKIASSMTARDYFLSQENRLLSQWGQKSLDLFRFTGEVFINEYEIKSMDLVQKCSNNYGDLYSKCHKQFQAYCILNRKVQKQNDNIERLAQYLGNSNHKRAFFLAWKRLADKKKHIRQMHEFSDKYNQKNTLRRCLKSWHEIAMNNIRLKIKNDVLQKTEIEISKIQSEYEQIIRNLEETLQRKLVELQKEEEEHRLLHDKYQNMVQRSKV